MTHREVMDLLEQLTTDERAGLLGWLAFRHSDELDDAVAAVRYMFRPAPDAHIAHTP